MARLDDEEKALSISKQNGDVQRATNSGNTLLPSRVASVVSFATRSSSVYLRVGSFVGGLAIDGARHATLTGFEITQTALEGVLSGAGQDVVILSGQPLRKAEAEGLLERSISILRSAITQASFVASTSFHLSSAALSSASALSQNLLSALDTMLGDTDSSRAITAIIRLIRQEFRNPETGVNGERVGLVDLLSGLVSLALLQRWGRRKTEAEFLSRGVEDTVWDVVIADDGIKVTGMGVSSKHCEDNPLRGSTESHISPARVEMMPRRLSLFGEESESYSDPHPRDDMQSNTPTMQHWPEADIKQHILKQLSKDAAISITTETSTTKTITVEISGTETPRITPPPGVTILNEGLQVIDRLSPLENRGTLGYRVVYQTNWNSSHHATVGRQQAKGTEATQDRPGYELPVTQRSLQSKNETEDSLPDILGSYTDRSDGQMERSCYPVPERPRDSSLSSLHDTFPVHPSFPRSPGSPRKLRNGLRASSNLSKAHLETDVDTSFSNEEQVAVARTRHRSASFAGSIYTIANNSESSLVYSGYSAKTKVDAHSAIMTLHHEGFVPGIFPRYHLVRNLTRFVRFSSASYGSNFLRLMGITSASTASYPKSETSHHHEHYSFSNHTRLPPEAILVSSYVDPEGGSNSAGDTGTGVPLVHYVSLDHESKAVILTCRGTLGFEDILTDMTCDYDDLVWRGQAYRVHKGMHASARRLLGRGGRRVMATIKAALEEFTEYGLVLCGHSLGGGVAAILAILISEPDANIDCTSALFTTRSQSRPSLRLNSCSSNSSNFAVDHLHLPSGRPVHVYAYGPPATVSPSLRLATRGLITSVVNGQDVFPSLSLGTLRDYQAVALVFKSDTSDAKRQLRNRVWDGLTGTLADKLHCQQLGLQADEEDQWAWSALKSLRASMLSSKLVPPGEVFVVETQPVLQRDAFVLGSESNHDLHPKLGRPATRVVLKLVNDVEARFGEMKFGSSMLGDHSPGRYELSLAALGKGVLDINT
ncbi:MAG: hypothetical protein M1827_001183 [Pycnora praestabilis]|nr:MAG: hypothetical protein M1827_001183 [Pycnora praestabilis]